MFRRLRVLAAFFLLPISLVFSMPGAAVAAPSEILTFHFSDGIPGPTPSGFGETDCQIGVATAATAVVVGAGGWCQSANVPSPFCDPLQVGCTTVTLAVQDGFESECGSGNLEVVSDSGYYTTTAVLGAASIQVGDCDPVQLCMSITYDGPFGDDVKTACTATSLDAGEEVSTLEECAYGRVLQVPQSGPKPPGALTLVSPGQSSYRGYWPVVGGTMETFGSPPVGGAWYEYTLVTGANSGASMTSPLLGSLRRREDTAPAVTGSTAQIVWDVARPDMESIEVQSLGTQAAVEAAVQDDVMAGRGIMWVPSAASPGGKVNFATDVGDSGRLGTTDPAQCSWYWGLKVSDIPNSTIDEPAGPLVPIAEPVIPPEVEPPDEDEQPADESSFWGAILAVLKSIWGAITNLGAAIGKIATTILDGIKDLFIPEGDVIAEEIDSLEGAWDDTSPAKYLTAVTDFQVGAVSGCGGMPLNVTLPGGVQVSESLGASCSGPMANVAALVRAALCAVLVIGGGMACVRAVGAGLGWSPGVGDRS